MLQNKKCCDLCEPRSVVRTVKSRMIQWAERVASTSGDKE
jgi:hypothetical protein